MRSAEDIIERLKKSFHTPSKKDERLKVVVICIVISTTFWFFSALNKDDYISQINYPIEIEFDGEAYIATGDLPSRIPLEVTGGGWDLMTRSFGFNMSPIKIALDDPDEAKHIIASSLRGQLTPRLDPVVINYILQDSLLFDIQKKVSRTFNLVLDPASISLESDYRIASPIVIDPDTVVWTGPEQIINNLDNTIYVNADLNGIDGDVNESIDIPNTPDLISTQIESVSLKFDVVRMFEVTDKVILTKANFPDTLWSLSMDSIAVTYLVSEASFDITDSARVAVYADYINMNPTDSTIGLTYTLKEEGVEEIRFSPSTVKARKNE